MSDSPIVLVPGYWLGAWAWDEVAALLRDEGHQVTALTLPGLDSPDTDRSSITMQDHVDAITDAVAAHDDPVVLVLHSGAGTSGYGATDRVPERIAAAVYLDTGPGTGPMDPEFSNDELPLPSWEELAEDPGNSLEGVSDEDLERFRSRAVPQPGGVVREGPELTNPARLDVPTTLVCTTYSSEEYQEAAAAGYPFLGGLNELRDVTYLDLPACHWSMWSHPQEVADVISTIARRGD